MTTLLDGKKLAEIKRAQLKLDIEAFKQRKGISPQLAAIIIGDDPASKLYVANKVKACHQVGLRSLLIEKPSSISESELLELIQTLNQDSAVHGILLQLPLPAHINPQNMIEAISVKKDVDGFHPYNIGRLALRHPTLRSCTPYGIMQLLAHYQLDPKGKNATIIGVSNIVGRPLSLELLLAGATVTSCHRHTKDLKSAITNADLIISATGQQKVADPSWIKPQAIVIDVGIHRINDKVCGDLDFDALNGQVDYLTPVPGGVGPMTITALLQNTLQAANSL